MSGDCSPQSEGRTDFNDNNNNIATSKQENEMRDTARARKRACAGSATTLITGLHKHKKYHFPLNLFPEIRNGC